jgi:selenocysteine-specific elongation factor
LTEIVSASGLESEPAGQAAASLIDQGELIPLKGDRLLITAADAQRFTNLMMESLAAFHREFPLRPGMPREQLKSQVGLAGDVFDALAKRLAREGRLEEFGATLRASGFDVVFSGEQQKKIADLMQAFEAQPYSPPSVKQCEEAVGEELLVALVETGQLVQLGEDVLFKPEIYQEMRDAVISHIKANGGITLAELRDRFNTSRKYAVSVLEYLDQTGVTIRRGDSRLLRRQA